MKVKAPYKLVRDFILPSLENKTYGSYLTWEDKINGSFKISRIHQNNEHFSQDCIKVYKDWSLRRNLWFPKDPKKITKAKHRLVTALRRSPDIEVLDKESSYYRFRFLGHSSSSNELSDSSSKIDDETVYEDKGDNENTIFHIDIKRSSRHCYRDDIAHLNRQEYNCRLSEELFRSSVIIKKSAELEIDENLEDLNSSEDTGNVLNNKCGCVVLLDSNFLCNNRCIWHGTFP